MSFQKQILGYVSFSEESKDFFRIGLIYYSEKSFVFSIEYLGDLNKNNLNYKQKEIMAEIKDKFGSPEDPELKEESLGGKGSTTITDPDGNKIFGYLYSIQYGQKAMNWFAERSALLPTKEELEAEEVPEGMERDSEEYTDYLNQYSKKTKEELYDMVNMSPQKVASKYQKPPVLTRGPTFSNVEKGKTSPKTVSLSKGKITEIPGMPTSTFKQKKVTVKEAIDVIFEAILNGEFDEDYEMIEKVTPEEGETKRVAIVSMNRLKTKAEFADKNGFAKRDDVPEIKGPAFFFLVKNSED